MSRAERLADVRAGPERAGAGDDLLDLSEDLAALIRDLASVPEAPVDVASGWEPGLAPGDSVGRFELLREIGRGGLGVSFEAYDRERRRKVALEVVRPGWRIATQGERWLRAEAEAVARLRHANVVSLEDFGRGRAGPFLVFEMPKGVTLADRLRAGALPLLDAVAIGIEVARALAHAHRAGVVHRDLEPANVLLCERGAVKVLDFGLAYLFGRGGPSGGGARAYMAPEQWRGSPGDERTDVFALGALLHTMISGEAPYGVEHDGSEALDPGPPPSMPRWAAPEELRGLVERMLEREPASRPQSARLVLRELLAVQRRLTGWSPARLALQAVALAVVAAAAALML